MASKFCGLLHLLLRLLGSLSAEKIGSINCAGMENGKRDEIKYHCAGL